MRDDSLDLDVDPHLGGRRRVSAAPRPGRSVRDVHDDDHDRRRVDRNRRGRRFDRRRDGEGRDGRRDGLVAFHPVRGAWAYDHD